MASELTPDSLDAILRVRRAARHAELLAQAKGKWTWKSIIAGILLLALTVFLMRSKIERQDVIYAMLLLMLIASWADDRLSRRLDAIVKLLEDRGEA